MGSEVAFHVHLGSHELKLTAKPKALAKPFGTAIVEPFLGAVNKKLSQSEQVTLADLESVVVGKMRVPDLAVKVCSLVPSDHVAGDAVSVDLAKRSPRDVRILCNGMQLDATLYAKHVHNPLGETVLDHFIEEYNKDPPNKQKLEFADVARVEVNGAETSLSVSCAEALPRGSSRAEVNIVLTNEAEVRCTPKEAAEGGAGAGAQSGSQEGGGKEGGSPLSQVFRVRCGGVELKLTLPAKALSKTLREAVVTPFLGAYAKKAQRAAVSADDVLRVEVDGMAMSDSLRATSVVSGAPLVRVELFLRPEAEAESAADGATSEAPTGAAPPRAPPSSSGARPNVDYSKWRHFEDGDEDDGGGVDAKKRAKAKAQSRALPEPKTKPRRSYRDWDQLEVDSGDEDEKSGGGGPSDGRLLLKDPEAPCGDWLEEACSLFGLSREQMHGFALAYPRVRLEDGLVQRAGKEARAKVDRINGRVEEFTFDVYGMQEHLPAGARVDDKKKASRCKLWVPKAKSVLPPMTAPVPTGQVTIPDGVESGGKLLVQMPDGHKRELTVPEGAIVGEALLLFADGSCATRRQAERQERAKHAEARATAEQRVKLGGELPLVILAHGALSHCRGPETLWLAWYLVCQYGCAVLAVDHLPHHGVRTPYGSATADDWPAADLSKEDMPWSGGGWERTLRRAANEIGYAMDVVLALPSAAELDRQNAVRRRMHEEKVQAEASRRSQQQDASPLSGNEEGKHKPKEYAGDVTMGGCLTKLAMRSRMRLGETADDYSKPRAIDPNRVGLVGFGLGGTSALAFLAADAAGKKRVTAAVVGQCGDVFASKVAVKERSAGGVSIQHVEIPGSLPSPPPAAFSSKLLQIASRVAVPVCFAASESDTLVPVERARALYDALGGGDAKRWHALSGARPMSTSDITDQLAWLHMQMEAAPPRVRAPPPAPPPSVAAPAAASASPFSLLRRTERHATGGCAPAATSPESAAPMLPAERSSVGASGLQLMLTDRSGGHPAGAGAAAGDGAAAATVARPSSAGPSGLPSTRRSERGISNADGGGGGGSPAGVGGAAGKRKLSPADHLAAAKAEAEAEARARAEEAKRQLSATASVRTEKSSDLDDFLADDFEEEEGGDGGRSEDGRRDDGLDDLLDDIDDSAAERAFRPEAATRPLTHDQLYGSAESIVEELKRKKAEEEAAVAAAAAAAAPPAPPPAPPLSSQKPSAEVDDDDDDELALESNATSQKALAAPSPLGSVEGDDEESSDDEDRLSDGLMDGMMAMMDAQMKAVAQPPKPKPKPIQPGAPPR